MSVYRNNWDNWSDVCESFDVPELPEPEEVIFADYDEYGNYDGSAFVVYRDGDKYFTVSGCHCSCYGLERQWAPEEYPSLDALIECMSRGHSYGSELDALDVLKSRRTPTPSTSVPVSSGGFTKH